MAQETIIETNDEADGRENAGLFILTLEECQTADNAAKLRNMLAGISKKALFITSVPFYWFLFFNYILNWQSMGLFVFVVTASYMTSLSGHGWGLLNWLAK